MNEDLGYLLRIESGSLVEIGHVWNLLGNREGFVLSEMTAIWHSFSKSHTQIVFLGMQCYVSSSTTCRDVGSHLSSIET